MGIFRGPGVVNDGLVFGYDTGYNDSGEQLASGRFFKGPSHSNLLKGHANSQSSQTTNYSFVYGTQEVEIPEVGVRTVKYCDYNNNRYAADGSVNSGTSCCPNLFYYHGSSPYVPVSANTSYTYSIIYKHTAGYTHPNFMYRYEYNNTTYVKEGGLHSTASDRRRNLGNGWYHAWGTFTTASTTTNLRCYSFLYNYGLQTDRFYVAGISIVENQGGGTHFVIPPQLMLEPLGSVSDTASLIDLKRTASIDVSDASFDSNAQLVFDGTDDYITMANNPQLGDAQASWEFVVKFDITHNDDTGEYRQLYIQENSIWIAQYVDKIGIDIRKDNNAWFDGNGGVVTGSQTAVVDANIWYHVVFTFNNGVIKGYLNNVLQFTTTVSGMTGIINGQAPRRIGRRTNQPLDGSMPVVRLYDTDLTALQVAQNYNSYKNRFNL